MTTPLWIIAGIAAVIVVWLIGAFNGFVRLKNRAKEAWADIDVQLKRRYDLIPNLVETVKGYASHEKSTLDDVINARSKATQMTIDPSNVTPEQIQAFGVAQTGLSQTLGKLLALSESYPDLKANVNFLELQKELSDTENKIQAARRFYNGNVRDLNIKRESFPSNIVAGMFGFGAMELFELENGSEERETPKVSF